MVSLLELRARNDGMKQRELADKLGVSQTTISNWEKKGIERLPIKKIKTIAAIFDVSIEELLEKDDFKSTNNN